MVVQYYGVGEDDHAHPDLSWELHVSRMPYRSLDGISLVSMGSLLTSYARVETGTNSGRYA